MRIFPAIDILGGRCVRLTNGRYDDVTPYHDDPVEAAKRWIEVQRRYLDGGDLWLHVVDLDGAKAGKPVNTAVIERICALGVNVQTGGGNRTPIDVAEKIGIGVRRVIIGTSALGDTLQELVTRFGSAIAVGIDVADGYVATHGWLERSNVTAAEMCAQLRRVGVGTLVYTDISRDGTMSGMNMDHVREMMDLSDGIKLIVGGGVRDMTDVENLCDSGVYGTIIGKALYNGGVDLDAAVRHVTSI